MRDAYQSFPPEPIRRARRKLERLEKLIEPGFAHLRKLFIENDCREPKWWERHLNGTKTKEQLWDKMTESAFRSQTEYGLMILAASDRDPYKTIAQPLLDLYHLKVYKESFCTLGKGSGDILLPERAIKALYQIEEFKDADLEQALKESGFEEPIDE